MHYTYHLWYSTYCGGSWGEPVEMDEVLTRDTKAEYDEIRDEGEFLLSFLRGHNKLVKIVEREIRTRVYQV